jgi:hypothetical protein
LRGPRTSCKPRGPLRLVVVAAEIAAAVFEIPRAVVEIAVVLVIAMVDLIVVVARARVVVSGPGIVMPRFAREVAAAGWSARPGGSRPAGHA